jgi:hypothetical protein
MKGEKMRLVHVSLLLMLSWCLLVPASYADLGSPTYAKAREEYIKGHCIQASVLLEKYRSEDREYLEKNPKILSSINNGIEYCNAILFPYLAGTSYPTGPPQQPDLPPSLANAFDTEARLKAVIEEIRKESPNYEQMEPMVRLTLRHKLQALSAKLKGLGDLVSITREGEQQNADVYEVKFANGNTAWLIGIAPNGNISTLECQ